MPVLANALPAVRARDAAADSAFQKRQLDPFESFLSSLLGGDETTTARPTRTTSTTTRPTSTPQLPTTTTSRTTRTTTSPRPTASQATVPPPAFTTETLTSQLPLNTGVADNSQNGQTQKKGLPAVVIGIIVAAAVIFGLIFIALLARKFFQRRRQNRRTTWGGSMISPYEPPLTKELPAAPIATAFSSGNNNNNNNTRNAVGTNSNSRYPDYSTASTYPAYPPAALGYANQNTVTPYSPAAPSSAGYTAPYPFGGTGSLNAQASTSAAASRAPAATPNQLSVVKRTFVPSLPDELSIANGETVRILSVYDDGWALCQKINGGEKGVVPQECLETVTQGASSNTPGQQLAAPDSGVRRNSSLRRDDGTRY